MRTPSRPRPTSLSRITPLAAALAGVLAQQAYAACTAVPPPSPSPVFCVTNTASTGPGSLHQAFLDATNSLTCANTTPTIGFQITGTGPFVISPPSVLNFSCGASPPGSIHGTLDGTSQAGYTPNSDATGFNSNIQIILDGSPILSPGAYAAINVSDFGYGTSLTIRGIEIRNYYYVYGGSTAIAGPVNVQGTRIRNVDTGIAANAIDPDGFAGPSPPGPANIGGPATGDRNVIWGGGASSAGIMLAYGGSAIVQNNLIGTLDGATSAGAPGKGIWVESAGPVDIRNNVVSGNGGGAGIYVSNSSQGVVIQDNKVGTTAFGSPLPNAGDGVHASNSSPVSITNNTIANNGQNGFNLPFGSGVELYGNRIHGNGVKAINLGNVPTQVPNDTDDLDTGANDLQNFPVISSVIKNGAANQTIVNWSLNSTPATNFDIEFFSNPAATAAPQATNPLTLVATSTGAASPFAFGNTTIPGLHDFITATATNAALGNTSEVGAAALAKGLDMAPTSFNFGNVVVGSTSPTQTATLASIGAQPFTINLIHASALCYGGPAPMCGGTQFNCATTCTTGQPYSMGSSCQISGSFSPIALGPANTTIYICDDAGGNPRTLTLTANAVAPPPATIAPPSHDFGPTEVNGFSASQAFTVNNPSPLPITLTPLTVTGPFQIVTNSCAASLPPAGSCTAILRHAPVAVGPSAGVVATTASTGGASATLAGTGTAGPPPTFTPPSMAFGAVQVGTSSAFATFTLNNPSLTPIPVGSFTVTGPFTLGAVACPNPLPAGGNCTGDVKFDPVVPGTASGSISITAAGSVFTSPLTGTGTATPTLGISPLVHNFGSVLVGATSAPKTFIIQNASPTSTALALSTNAPFQIASTTCGASIAGNGSCNADLTFAPTGNGPFSGMLVATGSAGSTTASLLGSGVRQPAMSLPTAPIEFGSMIVGSAPVSHTLELASTGRELLGINSIATTPPFTLLTTCGVSLPPNAVCHITVGFNPGAIGDFGGFLSVSTNAPGASFIQVPVHAAVQARPEPVVRVTPRAINFGARFAGSAAAPQNVTVTNEGGSPANLAVTLNGPHFSVVHTSCGATLQPGASCGIQVGFGPQGFGPKSSELLVSSNSADSPQGVNLSGAGCRPPEITQSRGATQLNCLP